MSNEWWDAPWFGPVLLFVSVMIIMIAVIVHYEHLREVARITCEARGGMLITTERGSKFVCLDRRAVL